MNTLELVKQETVDKYQLEYQVKAMYTHVASDPHKEYHFEMGRGLATHLGYSESELNAIPTQSIDSFAGVGYFFDLANLKNGDTVLDLGSGSGMDLFIAKNYIGSKGKAIGLDMTAAQLAKSLTLSRLNRIDVELKKGYIEFIPEEDNSIDAIISNGVINLSSDKESVFKEAFRVLKSGGRLAVSDIVTEKFLPASITCNSTLWAACIGGAKQEHDYLSLIEEAGFVIQEVVDNDYRFISNSAQGATQTYGVKSISILAIKA